MAAQLRALVEVAGEAVDRLALTPAESLHHAVAARVFRAVGPLAAPSRVIHDAVSRVTYASVRLGMRVGFDGAARAASAAPDMRPASPLLGALNAVIGDQLEARGSALAIPMSLHPRGGAGPRLALFVHGLGGSHDQWPDADLGLSRIYLRYNTGLPVAQNGARLARLLEETVAGWPVAVTELALVGHSMGGLMLRAAFHEAVSAGLAWPGLVRNLVTLGTPHGGAPLEKAVHVLAWALRRVPEAAPLGVILDTRSAGIKDLRRGSTLPLLEGCRHTFICATVTRRPGHPLGWAVGDLLVRTRSASGPQAASSRHLGSLHHFDLLRHPTVYRELRQLLAA